MQQMEGFQYATSFNLNMGCYTVKLSPACQYMITIVTKYGIFRYNCLFMGMCASGDIFQGKVEELLSNIEGVKTYIDDILVLGTGGFEKHMEQLRIIFGELCAAGLKVNAHKYSFGLK